MARTKQDITDQAAFIEALSRLEESTFTGHDLIHDDASRTMTLTLASPSTGKPGLLGRLRSHRQVVITVQRIESYRQSLTNGPDGVYILDRAEVGRGGREIAFYFRPGDRAVMDVDRIAVTIEETGRKLAGHRRPAIENPLIDRR